MARKNIISKPTKIIRILIYGSTYTLDTKVAVKMGSWICQIENINEYISNNRFFNLGWCIFENKEAKKIEDSPLEKLEDKNVLKPKHLIDFEIYTTKKPIKDPTNLNGSNITTNINDIKPYVNTALFKKIELNTAIISAKIFKNRIYLFFRTVLDALQFYNENKDDFDIKFKSKYCYEFEKWQTRFKEFIIDIDINLILNPSIDRSLDKETDIIYNMDKGTFSIEDSYSISDNNILTEFNDRIVFFGTISKKITLVELTELDIAFQKNDFNTILKYAKELCVGAQSNIFMQEILQAFDRDMLIRFINELEHDIGPISATKYGAYVVQNILNLIDTNELKKIIVFYFKKYASLLVTHPLGNYSIQSLIKFDEEFFVDLLINNLENIAKTNIGMKVFKKWIDLFKHRKEDLLVAIDSCEESLKQSIKKMLHRSESQPF